MKPRYLILSALCAVLAAYCLSAAAEPQAHEISDDANSVSNEPADNGSWVRINSGERHFLRIEVPAGETNIGLIVAGEEPLEFSILGPNGELLAEEVVAGGGIACAYQFTFKEPTVLTIKIYNVMPVNNGYFLVVL